MRSSLPFLVFSLAAAVAGCGEQPGRPPAGDQTVFSGIDVVITTYGYDSRDSDARDPTGAPVIEASRSAFVEINGGGSEGRVPGLRVFGDGSEIEESFSAGLPQQFSFQHYAKDPVHGKKMEVEFRYQGSTFSLHLTPLVVEITSPLADQTIAADGTLVLRWTGIEAAPEQAYVIQFGPSCIIGFGRGSFAADEVTFAPTRRGDGVGQEPPCRLDLDAEWSVEGKAPAAPFRSIRLEQKARRIQRFTVK